MILKNIKNKEREFKVLFKIKRLNQDYIIYEDILTNNIYGGLIDNDIIKEISDSEINFLEEFLNKIES